MGGHLQKGGDSMSTYEAMIVAISFGTFIVTLISVIVAIVVLVARKK